MQYEEIDNFMTQTGLINDPAFDDLNILIEPIDYQLQGKKILGLYYRDPARDHKGDIPAHTIQLPEDADYQTLLHELGHRYNQHYYNDMGESAAERYRMQYQYLLPASERGIAMSTESNVIPANARQVYEHYYPEYETYKGNTEQCTTQVVIHLPDQLFSANWVVSSIANTVKDQIADQGGTALMCKIYEDISPTWETDYYVVMMAAPAPVPRGAASFPFPWAIVVPLILVIIVIVSFTYLIKEIKTVSWNSPAGVFTTGLGIALGVGALLTIIGLVSSYSKGKSLSTPRSG